MAFSKRPIPITSNFSDDPRLQDEIDEFVYGISSRLDHVQEAEIEGDFGLCCKLMSDLAQVAETLGYALLFQKAQVVIKICADEDSEGLLEELCEMMHIVHRIKLGHRSTA